MGRMIFPNLAVSDLQRSVDFWTGLGFSFDPRLGDDNAACVVVSELASVSAESRAEVDRTVDRALATGGALAHEPQGVEFLYSRSFADPDGHLWGVLAMDPVALERQG